jgi:hypothetical protein
MDNIDIARMKLRVICSENFNDKTFEHYIDRQLAGDFAYEISEYIKTLENKAKVLGELLIVECAGKSNAEAKLALLSQQLTKPADDTISVSKGDRCQCKSCKSVPLHDSDCAVHNEPAYPNGPCDCILSQPTSADDADKKLAIDLLDYMYQQFENGDPCYEEGEGSYIGNAVNPDADKENAIIELLNRLKPKAIASNNGKEPS